MPAPRATLLRETPRPAPNTAKVIDATFTVVEKPNPMLARLKGALLTALWFALAGFLAPPLWLFVQRLSE